MSELGEVGVTFDGICWCCRTNVADSGEHKYKQSDLRDLWDGSLHWCGDDGETKRVIGGLSAIARDRHGILKFPKYICSQCNNSVSQPFDRAYEEFSRFVRNDFNVDNGFIDLSQVYSASDEGAELDLARYFVKHFGCRMISNGLPIPESMYLFINGQLEMQDVHLAFVVNAEVSNHVKSEGLSISGAIAGVDTEKGKYLSFVSTMYIGHLGIRFHWNEDGFPVGVNSFFLSQRSKVTKFASDENVALGIPD